MRHKKEIFKGSPLSIIVLVVLIVLTIIVAAAALMGPAENKKVCVILNESTSSEWNLLKEGLKQAADEYGVTLFVLTTDRFSTSEDMEKVVLNEAESYDGLIVGLEAFSDAMSLMEKLPRRLPVVLLNGNAEAAQRERKSLTGVSVDDYEIGKALAEEIDGAVRNSVVNEENRNTSDLDQKDGSRGEEGETSQAEKMMSVGILTQGSALNGAKRRLQGFTENCGESMQIIWTLDLSETPDSGAALRLLQQPDIMVSLHNAVTEDAAAYLENSETEGVSLYGAGYSTDAVYALDHGQIEVLAVTDEYNIGFAAVEMLAANLYEGRAMKNQTADFQMVKPDMIFDEDIRDLLFPVSQ